MIIVVIVIMIGILDIIRIILIAEIIGTAIFGLGVVKIQLS